MLTVKMLDVVAPVINCMTSGTAMCCIESGAQILQCKFDKGSSPFSSREQPHKLPC
jgi:hypothetical protein